MKLIACDRCGAGGLRNEGEYMICTYCGSKFRITVDDMPKRDMEAGLSSDIDELLMKCKRDPRNAKKYANLILDIDPDNVEAQKYL